MVSEKPRTFKKIGHKKATRCWRDVLNGEVISTKFRQRTCFLCRFCDIMERVMQMEENHVGATSGRPQRKKNRLDNYDYSSCGAYFITVCTLERRNYF